jgi:HAD superfamily hydrolase (TIGR01549 family)
MTEVIIFDCDGVLFDSRDANAAFYNHILQHLDLPRMTSDDAEFVHVSTARESIIHLVTRRNPARLADALAYSARLDYAPFIRLMQAEPHLKELLQFLSNRVWRAIATNRTRTIAQVLDLHGLTDYFNLVVSARDVSRPKPHPESLFRILGHFSATPDQALFVGDSEVDRESAARAAVPFVAYKNPGLRADYHVQDLRAIRKILTSRSAANTVGQR